MTLTRQLILRAYRIIYGMILLALISYGLLSAILPQFLTALSIPLWNMLSVERQRSISLIGGVAVVAFILLWFPSISLWFRDFYSKPPDELARAKAKASIILVIGGFIPGSIIIMLLPLNIRVAVIQVLLTLMFTILPASLYFLFMTTKGKTLWDEFRVTLTRLEPVGHHEELENIYKGKYRAIYGAIYGPTEQAEFGSTLLHEASFPVLFATFVVGLGWILFFFMEKIEPLPVIQFTPLSRLSMPIADSFIGGFVSPFTFGFLGAYLFSMHMLFRRYVQSDLKAVAYAHISQRILLTWIWAFVLNITTLSVTDDSRIMLISMLAFLVGVFPDIGWQVVTQFIQKLIAFPLPSFQEKHPLHKIDGITIWVEARLLEEDIENVENLVTTGILDLMIRTNLKPERLVHWIDQGVLCLHLDSDEKNKLREALREHGIVTATDLIYTYEAATATPSKGKPEIFLNEKLDPIVRHIVVAIKDDPNMYHVFAWREMNTARIARLPDTIKTQLEQEDRKSNTANAHQTGGSQTQPQMESATQHVETNFQGSASGNNTQHEHIVELSSVTSVSSGVNGNQIEDVPLTEPILLAVPKIAESTDKTQLEPIADLSFTASALRRIALFLFILHVITVIVTYRFLPRTIQPW